MTTTIDGSNESTFAAGVTCTALNGGQLAGNRNVIIGGNFTTNPWQRGTSFTNLANVQFSADRFQVAYVQDGVVDVIKTADSPTAAEAGTYSSHCLHLDVTTADSSLAANQRYFIRHHVEGLNTVGFGFGQAGARPITLSFWVKSTKTGTFCVALRNSASDRFFISEYTVNSTDTWEKKTISITADTTGTWLATNGIGLRIEWVIALEGTTFTATAGSWQTGDKIGTTNQVNGLDSASNDFKLALIQLEEGSVATPFERRPIGTELALCQRYYHKLGYTSGGRFAAGMAATATLGEVIINFPTTMRISPTALEQSGTASDYQMLYQGGNKVCDAVPLFKTSTQNNACIRLTDSDAGMSVGFAILGRYGTSDTGFLAWSVEL